MGLLRIRLNFDVRALPCTACVNDACLRGLGRNRVFETGGRTPVCMPPVSSAYIHAGGGCPSVARCTGVSCPAEVVYLYFTTSTAQEACPMTRSATLPMSSLLRPVLPWLPRTMRSAFSLSATSMIFS